MGAYGDATNGAYSGSAYVFDVSTGAQLTKLLPNDGDLFDLFGSSISIDNRIVAVGMNRDDDIGFDAGSAYLFDASTGEQIFKLLTNPSNGGETGNRFGTSIAISNGVVVGGAHFDDDNGSNSGSAYVFHTDSGATCPADLSGDGILDFFDVSAFLNAFSTQNPIADFTGEGIYDFFDVSAFLSAFSAGCPSMGSVRWR